MASAVVGGIPDSRSLFAIFKYSIYALLCLNAFLFFEEEFFASAITSSAAPRRTSAFKRPRLASARRFTSQSPPSTMV